jgi:hypothetical protein
MRVKHGEGFYQPVLGFIGAAKMKFKKMHGMIFSIAYISMRVMLFYDACCERV